MDRLKSISESLGIKVNFNFIEKGIHEGFIFPKLKIALLTDHQIFHKNYQSKNKKPKKYNKAFNQKIINELQPGDFVTHIDFGVGVYSGLQKINIEGKMQEVIRLLYKDKDILYVNIHSLSKISKYANKDGSVPHLHKLGSGSWEKIKEKAKSSIKKLAFDLIKLYAERIKVKGTRILGIFRFGGASF